MLLYALVIKYLKYVEPCITWDRHTVIVISQKRSINCFNISLVLKTKSDLLIMKSDNKMANVQRSCFEWLYVLSKI